MTTNQTVKNFQSLAQQYASVLAEVAPYRDRFHAFISHHNLNHGIDYRIEGEYHTPKADEFEMDCTVEGGIYFYHFVQDADGGDVLNFTIPFEYIEDPQAWEEKTLATLFANQSLVEKIYDGIAPGVREELNLDVYINYVNEDSISVVVVEKGNTGITLGHPQTEKMVTNSFSVNPKTGEIIHQSLIGAKSFR
jgi:hypothetical protein